MPIVDLELSGTTRGATGGTGAAIDVPRDAPFVTLILNFAPLTGRSTLVVRVVEAGGRELWTGRTVREPGTATLVLTLPRTGIPDGRYLIDVTADSDRGQNRIAEYRVYVRTPHR